MSLSPIVRAAASPASVTSSMLERRGSPRTPRPISLLLSLGVLAGLTTTLAAASSIRFLDLNGDGRVDKLISDGGGLSVSINIGGGAFAPVAQELAPSQWDDIFASDLDGDGWMDLYLLSSGENVALRGDGTGRFTVDTEGLGLADGGHSLSAERLDVDGFGAEELLLHNVDGDVLFWHTGRGFARDESTPALLAPSPQPDSSLAALELLVAQAAELLALDPGEELVLGLDEGGQPRVTLGSQRNQAAPSVGSPLASTDADVHGGDWLGATVGSTGPTAIGGHSPAHGLGTITSDEQEILDTMSIVMLDDGAGNLVNKTVRFTGVNVQVVNGLGATNGNTNNPMTVNPANTVVNGVGNLIVGYNELGNTQGDARTGSHNVVVGQTNSHSAFGGLVGGRNNTISGMFASVSGGEKNNAKARLGSISGGKSNTVKGAFTSISGGTFNTATGQNASISGGQGNKANGISSWVGGGFQNTATATQASVSGGRNNLASSNYSSVSGGHTNTASGNTSSISGGRNNTAVGVRSSVSGGYNNTASGFRSSVSGGRDNTASASYSSVSGGKSNMALGSNSSVSGGANNTSGGISSAVSGGSGNTTIGGVSSISGGVLNTTNGSGASVSGGRQNEANGASSSASGGYFNTSSASFSSVSGGLGNTASGNNSSVSGGGNNTASSVSSSVSGGNSRTTANTDNWAAGSLAEVN